MEVVGISFADPGLKTLLSLKRDGEIIHEVGTAHFKAGHLQPAVGENSYPRREVSIILEGKLRTTVDGETVILKGGDIVTIPAGARQRSEVLEDTRLVYLFLGA
ncbi:cupin domain-containing protein [Sphingobium sp.]|jgi:uncharacterized cupin superfamily protein|uniref:cupin domain-containing protein n=1 Tax=Sphingobium sp. TaxID=1912891 RepID=UPI000C62A4DE|nr:cupin domain-containing protein [Sphingobium sp.]MBS88308.1 hypothetical protein [Sphingobium sp.]|tara:strand:- start:15 stop:326 length:312 start_codon:yes stop_codon:yes gene_type:complete